MWFIKKHADYHDIRGKDAFNEKGYFTAIELGCFPTPTDSYHVYFGLYYQGRKPSLESVMDVMKSKVFLPQGAPGQALLGVEDDTWTLATVTAAVRSALKN